ncbi:mu-like prophage FluMu protein gp28 [Ylistrum balloti]|uniref:mu-like prophage FluMu protein gp28 n=1 Tax=Ylistrum balloti TaxID=509963 RepID=UPI0029059131|nr:mu-like prophage FluMu protein gp28 [Ylistrum balloti]
MGAIKLYGYQRRWLEDDSRFKIAMFARQTGKTFITTLGIVDNCLDAMVAGKRERWVILSRGERQAREAINEGIKKHCRAYQVAFEALEYDWAGSGGSYRALEVDLPGGSKITALPANPDTARGFSANVFLDEFAFHQDSRKIWQALFPVISKGFKLRVTSTPNGKDNKFYELMTDKSGRWSKHLVNIYQAVEDGLDRNIEELREAIGDEDAWAQEFECKWLDEASAWLPYDLISSVEDEAAGIPETYQGNPCFIGNDIAVRNDLWVAWVLELVGDVLWTREVRVLKRAPFAEQDAVLDELMNKYKVVRLAMDQTGLGEKPVEDAIRRYGEYVTEGVLFSNSNKYMLATVGKECFEDRRLRIPAGQPKLRTDLHKLKKTTTQTGAPKFVAESDSSGHADRAWALFLSIYAASQAGGPVEFAATDDRNQYAEDIQDVGHIHEDIGFGVVHNGQDLYGF